MSRKCEYVSRWLLDVCVLPRERETNKRKVQVLGSGTVESENAVWLLSSRTHETHLIFDPLGPSRLRSVLYRAGGLLMGSILTVALATCVGAMNTSQNLQGLT